MMRDREFMQQLINRAKKVGCSALILTADLQIMGQRHKDQKWFVYAAQTNAENCIESAHQTHLVLPNVADQTPSIGQYRRP